MSGEMKPWFRWYRGAASDVKFKVVALDASAMVHPTWEAGGDDPPITVRDVVAVWAAILERTNDNGCVTVSNGERNGDSVIRYISVALDLSKQASSAIVNALCDYGLLGPIPHGYEVKKWVKRQTFDTTNADRQRRHRERQNTVTARNGSRNASVTGTDTYTDTETEKIIRRADTKEESIAILKTVLDDEHARAVLDYRSRRKQSNSNLALHRLVNQLSQFERPNEGAAEMICRGWSGFRPDWMRERGQGPPRSKSEEFRRDVSEFLDEVDNANIVEFGRRALRGPSGGSGLGELHAATAGSENDAQALDANAGRGAKSGFAEDG